MSGVFPHSVQAPTTPELLHSLARSKSQDTKRVPAVLVGCREVVGWALRETVAVAPRERVALGVAEAREESEGVAVLVT